MPGPGGGPLSGPQSVRPSQPFQGSTDLLAASVGASAVAFDAVAPSSSGQNASAAASVTWTHTPAASGVAVVVIASTDKDSVNLTATYGGVAMTSLGKIHSNGQTAGYVQMWGLANQPATAQTVVVSLASGTGVLTGSSVSFSGADTAQPFGTPVTSAGTGTTDYTTATASVTTTASTGMVVAGATAGSGFTSATAPATSRVLDNWSFGSAAGTQAVATSPSTGGSVTMAWTMASDWFGVVAVEVLAPATATTALRNTAEGGSDSTTVTLANSGGASGDAFTLVNQGGGGGTILFEGASAAHGGLGYTLSQPVAANTSILELTGVACTSFAAHCYFRMDALPSALTQGPLMLRTSSAAVTRLDMQTTGELRLGTAAATPLALAAGVTYRLEWYGSALNGAAGVLTIDVYVGDSTVLYTTLTLTGQTTTGQPDRFRLGKQASGGTWGPLRFDDLAVVFGSAAPIGPAMVASEGWGMPIS